MSCGWLLYFFSVFFCWSMPVDGILFVWILVTPNEQPAVRALTATPMSQSVPHYNSREYKSGVGSCCSKDVVLEAISDYRTFSSTNQGNFDSHKARNNFCVKALTCLSHTNSRAVPTSTTVHFSSLAICSLLRRCSNEKVAWFELGGYPKGKYWSDQYHKALTYKDYDLVNIHFQIVAYFRWIYWSLGSQQVILQNLLDSIEFTVICVVVSLIANSAICTHHKARFSASPVLIPHQTSNKRYFHSSG